MNTSIGFDSGKQLTLRTLVYSPLSIFLAIILTLASVLSNPLLPVVLVVVFIFGILAFQNPLNLLMALVAYISIFASSGWGGRFTHLSVFVSYPVVVGLLFLSYARTWTFAKPESQPQSLVGMLFGIYILYSLLSFMIGVVAGHSLRFAGKEFMFILFYTAAPIAALAIYSRQDILRFLRVFLVISLITAFGYITLTLKSANLAEIFLQRVVTQQPHIALFSIPIAIAFWLYNAQFGDKILGLVTFPTVLIMVIISQTRALWMAIFAGILLSIFFSSFKSKVTPAVIYRAIFIMLAVMISLVVVILILDRLMLGSTLVTMATRIESIKAGTTDQSLAMRFEEIHRALGGWETRFLLGTGLGSVINRVATFDTYDIVDNGYMQIFWKQGLIGLALFLAPFIVSVYHGIAVIIKGIRLESKMIAAALICGVLGLMIVGLTNTSFIMYRFTILWGMFLVMLEKNFQFEVFGD